MHGGLVVYSKDRLRCRLPEEASNLSREVEEGLEVVIAVQEHGAHEDGVLASGSARQSQIFVHSWEG